MKELQSEYGVEADAIRLYAYRPTVFAIATSQHMLLNPYPQGEQAHRTMSIIVTKTTASERIEDVYSQYLEDHFIKSWTAKDTREIDESPPFVSRIKLSKDGHEASGLLSKEISEARPQTADLIEFSGEEVRDLLDKLTRKGTQVRLLLKHPGSVGETQRHRIINSYEYLKSHANPDLFQIRFYRFPSLIRGRRLDTRLLNVGWYTPDIISGDEWEIAGSRNPTVTSDPATPDGQALNEMFGRTFDDLWRYGIATAEVDSYIRSRHD